MPSITFIWNVNENKSDQANKIVVCLFEVTNEWKIGHFFNSIVRQSNHGSLH